MWLNGAPASRPGTIWVNTYRRGASQGEYRFSPDDYAGIVAGGARLADDYHTYAIDWQPGYVSW